MVLEIALSKLPIKLDYLYVRLSLYGISNRNFLLFCWITIQKVLATFFKTHMNKKVIFWWNTRGLNLKPLSTTITLALLIQGIAIYK